MRFSIVLRSNAFRRFDAGAPWFHNDGAFAGFVGSCLDITDYVQVRRVLAETEELYRATLESLQDGVIVTDADGRVVSMNPAAEYLTGHASAGLLGRHLSTLSERIVFLRQDGSRIPPSGMPDAVARTTGRPVVGDMGGWARPGGQVAWHRVVSQPLRATESDSVFPIVTSFVDVTEHTRATELALHQALHDPLTGVVNRAGLGEILLRVAARTPRVGATMAVALLRSRRFQ